MKKIKTYAKSLALTFSTCFYAPMMMAADSWFPKISDADNIGDGSRSMMDVMSNYVKQGLSILMFIAAVVTFIKFITTIQHGIEEAKKSEGSLVAFGSFAVMGIIYLAISIASGYVGYAMITKFKV